MRTTLKSYQSCGRRSQEREGEIKLDDSMEMVTLGQRGVGRHWDNGVLGGIGTTGGWAELGTADISGRFTPLACGPSSPELSKSKSDMASKLFTFT